jgi:protein-S-isoprenylcysteine O-methyltransferase Ste14
MVRFTDWYMHRIPGGAGLTQPRQAINLAKLMVGPVVLILMLHSGDFSIAAWLYLALHGMYGILWVTKDVAFGDPRWRSSASLSSAVAISIMPLGLYYLPAFLMLTPLGEMVPGGWGTTVDLPRPVAFAAVVCFALGAFIHFVSDAQKYFVLRERRRLITDGMFAATRNPNYFGEILIYSSFNLLAQHWLPWVACGTVWVLVFLVNMLHKDASMSRYPEHAEWVRRTGLLLPHPGTLLRSLPRVLRDRG